MVIKQHLSGVAIAFPEKGSKKGDGNTSPFPSRPQGSLYGQQKRKIADAIEYMRRYGKHKPLIFVLTSPGFTNLADEGPLVSKFVNNLRMRYNLEHYVWVREVTERGYPHFHFVATIPFLPAEQLSLLWSSYFGSDSNCSIRLGTKPDKNGKRKFFVSGPRMANYMSKYIGKGIEETGKSVKTKIKTFAISQELGKLSGPMKYTDALRETVQGYHERVWLCDEVADWADTEGLINTKAYHWTKVSDQFNVYFGRKKYRKRTDKSH